MALTIKTQNLQRKNGMLLTVSQKVRNHDPIKLQTKSIESSLCEYSDAYILVKGNITVTRTIVAVVAGIDPQRKQPLDAATQVVFKNCATFKNCSTEIDGTLVDEANFINFTMPMYNLIEYSDNYSDTSESLWGFKRDEQIMMQMRVMITMPIYFNIKQVILVIQKTVEQRME